MGEWVEVGYRLWYYFNPSLFKEAMIPKHIILRTEDDDWIIGEFELNVEGFLVFKQGLLHHTLSQAIDSIKSEERNARGN